MRLFVLLFLLIVPWLATFSGSMISMKLNMDNPKKQAALLGFAAGVMLAASVWSLIIPAFEETGTGFYGIFIVSGGFVLGCLGMLGLDKLLPHQHRNDAQPEGHTSHLSRPMLLVMAVALHNIPEGLSLGVIMAAFNNQTSSVSMLSAIIFGCGLALQNFPEGMAVTLPMLQAGIKEKKCRQFSILVSFAEPAAAVIGFFLASFLTALGNLFMPLLLALAAGAMIFIVVEELIPETQSYGVGHPPTYGFLIGFWVMAVMGIASA